MIGFKTRINFVLLTDISATIKDCVFFFITTNTILFIFLYRIVHIHEAIFKSC